MNKRQLLPALETTPVVLSFLHQFEGHGECRHSRTTPFGLGGSQTHRGKHTLNDVRAANVLLMSRRHLVEGEKNFFIFLQARDGLRIFVPK